MTETQKSVAGSGFGSSYIEPDASHPFGLILVKSPNGTDSENVKQVRSWIDAKHRVKVLLKDGRTVTGTLGCMDERGNLIVQDAIETRPITPSQFQAPHAHTLMADVEESQSKHLKALEAFTASQATPASAPEPSPTSATPAPKKTAANNAKSKKRTGKGAAETKAPAAAAGPTVVPAVATPDTQDDHLLQEQHNHDFDEHKYDKFAVVVDEKRKAEVRWLGSVLIGPRHVQNIAIDPNPPTPSTTQQSAAVPSQ